MESLPARIDEVTFAVADLDEAVAFYSTLFGAEPMSATDAIATFQLQNCRLVLISREVLASEMHVEDTGGPAPTTAAIIVARNEVDELEKCLVQAGASTVASAEDKPSGPRIAFAQDRDGHIWEILGR